MSTVTCEDLHPSYPPRYTSRTGLMSHTINCRVLNGYPKWGFVIYRGTYTDDALWVKALTLL